MLALPFMLVPVDWVTLGERGKKQTRVCSLLKNPTLQRPAAPAQCIKPLARLMSPFLCGEITPTAPDTFILRGFFKLLTLNAGWQRRAPCGRPRRSRSLPRACRAPARRRRARAGGAHGRRGRKAPVSFRAAGRRWRRREGWARAEPRRGRCHGQVRGGGGAAPARAAPAVRRAPAAGSGSAQCGLRNAAGLQRLLSVPDGLC